MSTQKAITVRLRPPRKPVYTLSPAEQAAWFGDQPVLTLRQVALGHGRVADVAIGTMAAGESEWVPALVLEAGSDTAVRMEMHVWDLMSLDALRGCAACRAALDVPKGTRLIWAHGH